MSILPSSGFGRRRYASRIAGAILVLLAVGVFLLLLTSRGDRDDASAGDRPKTRFERRAERVQERLAENPNDPRLLLATMRAWLEAGSDLLYEVDFDTQPIPAAVSRHFRAGLSAWDRYLDLVGEDRASLDAAENAGDTYFLLVEIGSRDLDELEADATEAARALQIAGRTKRTTFTLSNAAIYSWFAGQFAVGDRAARGAIADADADSAGAVRRALEGSRKRGRFFREQLRRAAEELEESGEELLEEPLRGYLASVGVNKEDPLR